MAMPRDMVRTWSAGDMVNPSGRKGARMSHTISRNSAVPSLAGT